MGTILLNMAYLALRLYYLYPLKFLFSILLGSWFGIDLFPKASEKGIAVLMPEDFPQLIIIFSIGYMLIWSLLCLMHHRAMKAATSLQLTPYELAVTLAERRGAFWNAMIGLAAILLAWGNQDLLAGVCCLLIPLALLINQRMLSASVKAVPHQPS